MTKRSLTWISGAGLASLAALPVPAMAAVSVAAIPQAIMQIPLAADVQCAVNVSPALGAVRSPASTGIDKSSAILGGGKSRLQAIMQQQQRAESPIAALAAAAGTAGLQPTKLANVENCANFSASTTVLARSAGIPSLRAVTYNPEDFLGSKRLRVRHTGFDHEWSRVQSERLSGRFTTALTRATAGTDMMSRVSAVNSWANARIRYVEDSALYGRTDYWASATTTLKRGAGDCEDIAIAKMQLLASLGMPRSDMYLTIARDLVRNSDHAVLIVKYGGRHWMLDNSTNELLDASTAHDYRPIMSFNTTGKWLHGYSRF